MSGKVALHKVVRWIEEDAEADVRVDPYRVIYRNADVTDAPFDALDDVIRSHLGIALDDPRRLRFLLWVLLDERCRSGHSAVPYADVIGHLLRRSACTVEAAREAVRFVVLEGAAVGARFGKGEAAACVQLEPYARAEAFAADWIVDRLKRLKA